jgi:hypothetical protein
MTTLNMNSSGLGVPAPLRQLSNELSRIAVTYRATNELMIAPSYPRIHTRQQIRKIAKALAFSAF